MFNVNGDIIEYDGKPFAVITAGLSGFRMDAVDALNSLDEFHAERVNELAKEERADDLTKVEAKINDAIDTWSITETAGASLLHEIRAVLE